MRIACVSSRDPKRRFGDIIRNVDAITSYTTGLSEAQYRANQLVIDATERCLLRISEAAVKLGHSAERLAPGMPWADIRGIGNWLRHGYDEINQDAIWEVVCHQLTPLRAAAAQAISQIEAAAQGTPVVRARPRRKTKARRKTDPSPS